MNPFQVLMSPMPSLSPGPVPFRSFAAGAPGRHRIAAPGHRVSPDRWPISRLHLAAGRQQSRKLLSLGTRAEVGNVYQSPHAKRSTRLS